MSQKTMKVIIAEDEDSSRAFLRSIMEKHKDIEVLAEAADGSELVKLILKLKLKPQVVFVDIEMPELDGLSAMKKVINKVGDILVVFVTGHSDFAVEAFEIAAFDYILKPYRADRVEQVLDRIRERLIEREHDLWRLSSVFKSTDMLYFKCGYELHFVDPSTIYFIEKDGKRTIVHTTNNKYDTHESLNDLETRLDAFHFFRSHKCYLINLKKIEKIAPWGENTHLVKFINTNKDALIARAKVKMLYDLLNVGMSEPDTETDPNEEN